MTRCSQVHSWWEGGGGWVEEQFTRVKGGRRYKYSCLWRFEGEAGTTCRTERHLCLLHLNYFSQKTQCQKLVSVVWRVKLVLQYCWVVVVLWFGLWTGVVLSHSSEPVHSSVTHQLTHVGELTQPYHPGFPCFRWKLFNYWSTYSCVMSRLTPVSHLIHLMHPSVFSVVFGSSCQWMESW